MTTGHAQAPPGTGGRIMAIDLGERRIGIAVSDPGRIVATPVGAIVRRAGKRLPVVALVSQAAALDAVEFVVGLPLDAEGADTPRAVDARWLAGELTRRTGKPVRLIDERYSTAKARRAIHEMGGVPRARRNDVDALAAAILLQHALDIARSQ